MVLRLIDAWLAFRIGKRTSLRKVRLVRDPSQDTGTNGVLTTDSGLRLYSLEPPDRGNKVGMSCIPLGVYECVLGDFPKHGKCYEVRGVKDRTQILAHAGNFGGDTTLGYRTDTEGCILLGNAMGDVYDPKGGKKQAGILGSKDALSRFEADMEGEPFTLEILLGPWAKA